jgi:hypothetical protein
LIRRLALLGLLFAGRVAVAQSPIVRIDDAGPGVGPLVLGEALSHPIDVVPPADGQFLVSRGTDAPRSIVVLGRDVAIEGHVHGDVVVINGDIYMHPGGAIDGRALTFGGGVYESSLATIAGGIRVFRDFTYYILPIPGGYALRYRSLVTPPEGGGLSLPGIYGVASPEYDRSEGLALGYAPRYAMHNVPLVVAPKVTYRSQLGEFDPSLEVEYNFSRKTKLTGRVERATMSNDRWIRTDLLNSADFLYSGVDTRNYYRAVYGESRLSHLWEFVDGDFTPYVGGRVEDAKSVRPGLFATGGPWTLLNRSDDDRDGRLRLNPPISEGSTYSGLIGGLLHWTGAGLILRLRLDGEIGTFDPTTTTTARQATFGQATLQGHLEFPTFSQQFVAMDGHFIATTSGNTPRQRYAYFGGSGTIPMLDLLSEGGDELIYVDGRYVIPVHWFNLPFFGVPAITLREILGGAAVRKFPSIHQAVGGRIALKWFYGEFLIDPDTHRTSGGVGISLSP